MKYLKQPFLYIGGIIIIALAVLFFSTLSPRSEPENLVTVAKGNIKQEVLLTGIVKPARFAELSFDRTGVLMFLPVTVSSTVRAGAILAVLKNETENAAVAEARAARAGAEARLAQVLRGARPEELRVKEAAKTERETALKNLTEKSAALIADAYNASDEALNRYADPLFSNDDSAAARLTFSSGNQNGVYEAEYKRIVAGTHLKALRARVTGYDGGTAEAALAETLLNLRDILALFLTLDTVLTDGSGLAGSTLANYKERIASARGKVVSAQTATQNHLNGLRESAAALQTAESELALSAASATAEETREAEEELAQASAQLRFAEAALEKTVLRAPFGGRITSRNGSAGETVTSREILVTLEGAGGFIIETEVPEADSARIRLGDEAVITLDAFKEDVLFTARVSEIEQSEKVIEGVSTYKTTLTFTNEDSRSLANPRASPPGFSLQGYSPRSGMTANIVLTTKEKWAVLVLPFRALANSSGKQTVTVLRADGTKETREVVVGLRGGNGMVEIVSGLTEGERVLTDPKGK